MYDGLTAAEVRQRLGLAPHPEGGHFRETWRHAHPDTARRDHATAIVFLLAAGERSHWHTVDAAELWVYHAGAPLELSIHQPGGPIEHHRIGMDIDGAPWLQHVVPPHAWQAARSLGDWTLVGCVVVPAFEFAGFTLAAPGWEPGHG